MFIGLMVFLSGHRHFRHTLWGEYTRTTRSDVCPPTWAAGADALHRAGVLYCAAGK